MKTYYNMSVDELCPYVRKVGIQNKVAWKNRTRKIYDYEMLYCISGKAHIIIQGEEFHITEGVLITIPPNTSHSFCIDEKIETVIYWVHFDFIYREDVYSLDKLVVDNNAVLFNEKLVSENFIRLPIKFDEGFTIPLSIEIKDRDFMNFNFKNLYLNYHNKGPFWQVDCKIFMLSILKIILKQLSKAEKPRRLAPSKISDIIIKYVSKNYNRKINLTELSVLVGFNEDYLGKIFKKETGFTIIEFINRYRINKSKELLLDKDFSIQEVSEVIGFKDVYYFSRMMKKYEGVSPMNWRKQYL